MTRINTIPPSMLTDQHLMAEYREMPMVNASLARTLRSKRGLQINGIPKQYTLNSGHVTFHYDKGLYLFKRFSAIVDELNNRQYNVKPDERSIDWDVFRQNNLWNDWHPSHHDHKVNVERIVLRINQKVSWYRYKGSSIDTFFVEAMYSRFVNLQEA